MNSSNFVKEKKLGNGSFGVVYRVRSKRSNKLYVIKEQPMNSSILVNEVEVLKKMRPHRNVIAYHGSWLENGKGCILMEYASRGSLDDIMKLRAGPIPEEQALYLFAQIVLGVNHIHRQSVIHRDLKPANIMIHRVTADGGRYMDIIKIGDFGISKDTGGSIARTVIGTKMYMAPETFRGSGYGYKCDMWSCGVILYELLTDEFPFRAPTIHEMMRKIQRGRVPPITSGNISRSTLAMTYKLMSVNPDERPRSTHLVDLPVIAKSNRVIRDYLGGDCSTAIGRTTTMEQPSGPSVTFDEMLIRILRNSEIRRRQDALHRCRSSQAMRERFSEILKIHFDDSD